MHKAHVIRQFTQHRHQIRNHLAAFTARLKFPGALGKIALLALKGNQIIATGHGLAMAFDQLGFVIEGVELTASTRAKDQQNALGFGGKVSGPGGKRMRRIDLRPQR